MYTRRKIDVTDETDIVKHLIVSDVFCKTVIPILMKEPQLISTEAAQTVVRWVAKHYDKYAQAPRKDIQKIFDDKSCNMDDPSLTFVNSLLARLSDEWEQSPEEFNAQFHIDRAVAYLKKESCQLFADELKGLTSNGDIEGAQKLIQEYKPISIEQQHEEIITGEELYDMEITEPTWLIEDLIPKGLTIVAGKSKVGKSTFVLNAVMALVQREKAFDHFWPRPGNVLYLSLEDDKHRIQKRMHDIKPNISSVNKKRLGYIDFRYHFPKLQDGGLQRISGWAEEQGSRARLVVIDVFEKVRSRRGRAGNANLYAEDYEAFGPLSDLVKKHPGLSILVLTHTTKAAAQDVFDQILGSMGTQGVADTLIVLSKQPGQKEGRVVSIRGKDIEERHLAFSTGGYRWIYEGEADEQRLSHAKQRIVDFLDEADGVMTPAAIKAGLRDSGIKSIDVILGQLYKSGEISKVGQGKYAKEGFAEDRIRSRMRGNAAESVTGKKRRGLSLFEREE
jgi:hypothetical protein